MNRKSDLSEPISEEPSRTKKINHTKMTRGRVKKVNQEQIEEDSIEKDLIEEEKKEVVQIV